jgi:hypothetical protein
MENDGGMILTGENEELGEKPVPVPLCPPQIPHGLARERTRASAVTDRRLTITQVYLSHGTAALINLQALLLYLVQHSVETTYYIVNGHCSCRPANIRFFRPGIFK